MWGEYGYMEEGQLGKPYNIRLLRRLARYAYPYRKVISSALFLTILITLLDLAVPYLSKVAIDRFILASWYRVDFKAAERTVYDDFIKKYGDLIEKSMEGAYGLISHLKIQKIDPSILREYREKGIISQKGFYKVHPDAPQLSDILRQDIDHFEMLDGSIVIPIGILNQLPTRDILHIRKKDVRGFSVVSGVLLLFLLVSFGLGYGEYYLLELAGQNIMQDIRLQLFSRMQSQAISFFDRHPVGRLVTRVTNDIENLNEMFKSVIITVFKDIFILSGILAVLLYLNWRLALVSFIILPFIFGLTLLFSSMARDAFRELREKVAKLNAFLQERLSGMRIIQLFVKQNI